MENLKDCLPQREVSGESVCEGKAGFCMEVLTTLMRIQKICI